MRSVAMDVKEAVRIAKDYASTVFEGETIRIEEIWYEDNEWFVTIGLQRQELPTEMDEMLSRRPSSRTHYKTVRVDEASKTAKSVKNRAEMPVSPL
jgi:hypothetical protein